MSCTTILVGKDASYDGSTMIARNDDSGAGHFTPKKMVVLPAREGDTEYTSVLSHVKVSLPYKAYRCTIMPNAVKGKGLWGACGVNEKEVGMTATETITSNPRVLGADPLVEYQPADDTHPEVPGGIGEEDLVILTLPYINSAREGVQRLGALLEKYGTYEMNGIAFSDKDEIWWLETIGGHHWMARRVPDDSYVVMPNQQGIDEFDFEDALGEQADFMCSSDLLEFVERYHLDLTQYFNDELELEEDDEDPDNTASDVIDFRRGFDDDSDTDSEDDESDQALSEFDPRAAFGSHDDADHVYNTPRAWFMLRYFNPTDFVWDGPDADYKPESDDLPWCLVPEKKITPEDVKYVLSSHFQGTPYDPYKSYGDKSLAGAYRSIGINRNDFLGFIQIRPYMPEGSRAIEWVAFASNAFNAMIPLYPQVDRFPDYLSNTTGKVSTDNFYWTSRLIAALSDAGFRKNQNHIERYQLLVQSKANRIINTTDDELRVLGDPEMIRSVQEKANAAVAELASKAASDTLRQVLDETSNLMKNQFARSDA